MSPEFFAADGHFGNQSNTLVKNYAESLGFEYYSARNKKEFEKYVKNFTDKEMKKPILFEVFTRPEDESNALEMIYSLEEGAVSSIAKKMLGSKGKKLVKKVLGR